MTSFVHAMLASLPTETPARRDVNDPIWWSNSPGSHVAGQHVTHDTALQLGTYWAAVRCIAETFAAMPFGVFQRLSGGDKEPQPFHPISLLLGTRKPNDRQTAYQFKATMVGDLLQRGNFYAEIIPGELGPVSQLRPIHPDFVRIEDLPDGRLRYIEFGDGAERVFVQEEIWHLRGLTLEPGHIRGVDPLTVAAKQAAGMGLAAQDYGARFFQNDARPGGLIKHPSHFKDDESRANYLAAWRKANSGAGRHSMAVLEYGFEYEAIGLTNEQAQFIETRKLTDIDMARIMRVPPHMVAILDNATFTNIEHQGQDFVRYTLLPWAVNIEQSINNDLIMFPGRFFAKFNFNGLMRGDLLSRYQAYAIGRNWGWMSANDIRRLEDMNSIGPDGDLYLQPLNMVEAGEPGEPSGMGRTNGAPPQQQNGAQINGEQATNGVDHHEL